MNLHGCVNDARSMFGFLVDRLHVPTSNLVLLTDMSATRQAIISKFEEHLLYNKYIQRKTLSYSIMSVMEVALLLLQI